MRPDDPADVRAFRERHGLTQEQLAALLLLPNPKTGGRITVARWEAGTREPPPFLPLALETIAARRITAP